MNISKTKHLYKKCFCDEKDNVVLFQLPNIPFIVWFSSFVLSSITTGTIQKALEAISFGALFTWAWLEVFKGTNYFRRVLGMIVLVVIIYNRATV